MNSAKCTDKVVFSVHRAERRVRNVKACLTVMGGWIIPHEGQVWAEPFSSCPVFLTASTHPPLPWCFLSQLGNQSSFPQNKRGFQNRLYKSIFIYTHTPIYFQWKCFFSQKGRKARHPTNTWAHGDSSPVSREHFLTFRGKYTASLSLHLRASVHICRQGHGSLPCSSDSLLPHILTFHPLPRVIKLILGKDLSDFQLLSAFFPTCSPSAL